MRMDYLSHSFPFNHKNFLIKLLLTIFFFGLAFRLFFFHSLPPHISPLLESPLPEKATEPSEPENPPQNPSLPEPVPENEEEDEDQVSHIDPGKCDYFSGDWVPNPSGPVYTNESCNLIEAHQNCLKNGRPDREFLYWKWVPRDCELPQFDPQKFLNMMRNKVWALIGDSIQRNHVQSLLCMLSTVEQADLVYHDEEYKSKSWLFPSYNFSVSVIWSPFLVEAAIFEDINGVSSSEVQLYLDKLDSKWTDQYLNFDYIIISTGKWTSTPDHFENGEWFSGGTCNRTSPIKEGEMEMKDLSRILRDIELEEFGKAASEASRNGVNFQLVDLAPLSLLRPDGHPGPYRHFHPFDKRLNAKIQNDCLHWCLPGPIDSWNDILMEMVVNG
ncbi:PMR5 N-terminal domain [Sesbania bispinosa]|nr:PMR5 N-terminal domain [Sesbania bispinosa]